MAKKKKLDKKMEDWKVMQDVLEKQITFQRNELKREFEMKKKHDADIINQDKQFNTNNKIKANTHRAQMQIEKIARQAQINMINEWKLQELKHQK